jgi:hypothetical protein
MKEIAVASSPPARIAAQSTIDGYACSTTPVVAKLVAACGERVDMGSFSKAG